jgi:hypothetical protein
MIRKQFLPVKRKRRLLSEEENAEQYQTGVENVRRQRDYEIKFQVGNDSERGQGHSYGKRARVPNEDFAEKIHNSKKEPDNQRRKE